MSIYRSGLIFGFSTFAKLASGLVIIKMIAWELTPAQFGVLGQLMTAVAIVGMFAGGGVGNGLIKLLASSKSESDENKTINAAMAILLISSGIIFFILVIAAKYLSIFVFENTSHEKVFLFLAISQLFVGFGNLILAILSSKGHAWVFAKLNIYGTIFGLILFVIVIHFGNFTGAAYGLVFLPASVGFISALLFYRREILKLLKSLKMPDYKITNQLLSYSVVMLVAVSVLPLAQMLTRNYMSARVGWTDVGYWQGVLKISDVYMQFIGIILINYSLPKFSKCETCSHLISEFKRNIIPLLGVVLLIVILIYLGRSLIIRLIFSQNFLPMQSYFFPQLLGDFFRTIASTITYLFLAKNNKTLPIISEIYQGVAFFGFTVLLYPHAKEMAPLYAHLLTFSTLAVMMGFWLWRYLDRDFIEAGAV